VDTQSAQREALAEQDSCANRTRMVLARFVGFYRRRQVSKPCNSYRKWRAEDDSEDG
jgi:hypothetical protein